LVSAAFVDGVGRLLLAAGFSVGAFGLGALARRLRHDVEWR